MNVAEKLLPFAKPWILIDGLIEEDSTSITSFKLVSSSDFYVQGHFVENSIYPGILFVEGMKHTAMLWKVLKQGNGMIPAVTGVQAKFMKPVVPGDKVVYRLRLESRADGQKLLYGEGKVGTEAVVRSVFTLGSTA